jgi:hypothetical protein
MAACATQGNVLEARAQQLQRDLENRMRRFGRPCRGIGQVCVTLVRQPERQLLEMGAPVLPPARAAQAHVHRAPLRWGDQRVRLDTQLVAALAAQHPTASPSRRRT